MQSIPKFQVDRQIYVWLCSSSHNDDNYLESESQLTREEQLGYYLHFLLFPYFLIISLERFLLR